jgi:hypothetical protein
MLTAASGQVRICGQLPQRSVHYAAQGSETFVGVLRGRGEQSVLSRHDRQVRHGRIAGGAYVG